MHRKSNIHKKVILSIITSPWNSSGWLLENVYYAESFTVNTGRRLFIQVSLAAPSNCTIQCMDCMIVFYMHTVLF